MLRVKEYSCEKYGGIAYYRRYSICEIAKFNQKIRLYLFNKIIWQMKFVAVLLP